MKIFGFFGGSKSRKSNSSDFSVFFREASSGEKKRVFKDVAIKASEDQKRVIEAAGKITTPTTA
jgi:hypothetical protein